MAVANLALRFILEVLGIAALAYSGFQVPSSSLIRAVAGIGAPLALIIVWAMVVAPNTANGLSQAQKDVIGTVLLLVAAIALGFAGQLQLAVAFGIVVVVNAVLLILIGQDGRSALNGMAR